MQPKNVSKTWRLRCKRTWLKLLQAITWQNLLGLYIQSNVKAIILNHLKWQTTKDIHCNVGLQRRKPNDAGQNVWA